MTLAPLPALASAKDIMKLPFQTEPLRSVVIACIAPSCLGYYKPIYVVQYGYPLAILFSSLLALQHKTCPDLWHILALSFYGVRLTLFLLYRELNIPQFRRSKGQGERWKRTPMILICSILYMCMAAPLFVAGSSSNSIFSSSPMHRALQFGCVALTWAGFVLAALGDHTKTRVKKGDKDVLVTSGVYRFLRHPNYTGEQIGWTGNMAAGIVTVVAAAAADAAVSNGMDIAKKVLQNPVIWASIFGWIGIEYVLCSVNLSLENKQKEKYGDLPEYRQWVEKSWAGFQF